MLEVRTLSDYRNEFLDRCVKKLLFLNSFCRNMIQPKGGVVLSESETVPVYILKSLFVRLMQHRLRDFNLSVMMT